MHIEMGWHRDENGGVVFDEMSLCAGPDPNGITDVPDCVAHEIMNPPVRYLSMGCIAPDRCIVCKKEPSGNLSDLHLG